jgi:molybdopterin-guanine dinucleotide biosynthesis protein MobB
MSGRTQALFGLAGWSGSGKTTLVRRLIPALTARGLRVSTIKHAHHNFDVDEPGKDSYEHRQAGATEVMVSSARRWALMHELRGDDEATLDQLLDRMSPVDVVLVEGFKRLDIPKLEVHRPSVGKPLLCADDAHVIAVASDEALTGLSVPVLSLDDIDAVAALVIDTCGLSPAGIKARGTG